MKIRLMGWGDRMLLGSVRAYHTATVPSDLFELLTWPTYHCHGVWQHQPGTETEPEGSDAIVAYGALGLCADGKAEATEMVVLPAMRRCGLASWLRLVQCRDLEVLGFTVLYQSASTPEAKAFCATHMEPVGALPGGGTYFRGTTDIMRARLEGRQARRARPMDEGMVERTRAKAKAAWRHLEKLHALADTQRAKLALRSA